MIVSYFHYPSFIQAGAVDKERHFETGCQPPSWVVIVNIPCYCDGKLIFSVQDGPAYSLCCIAQS